MTNPPHPSRLLVPSLQLAPTQIFRLSDIPEIHLLGRRQGLPTITVGILLYLVLNKTQLWSPLRLFIIICNSLFRNLQLNNHFMLYNCKYTSIIKISLKSSFFTLYCTVQPFLIYRAKGENMAKWTISCFQPFQYGIIIHLIYLIHNFDNLVLVGPK